MQQRGQAVTLKFRILRDCEAHLCHFSLSVNLSEELSYSIISILERGPHGEDLNEEPKPTQGWNESISPVLKVQMKPCQQLWCEYLKAIHSPIVVRESCNLMKDLELEALGKVMLEFLTPRHNSGYCPKPLRFRIISFRVSNNIGNKELC